MIGMDLVTELVKTTILTGRLANHDLSPVSILLISPPEHGKTSIVMENRPETLIPLTDLTGTGVKAITNNMDKITHIAVLDLLMATSHKNKVSQHLLAWMNAVAEEGYIGEATPDGVKVMKQPMKKAFICCLTPDMNKDGRRVWNKIGFSSRMVPFFYLFSDSHTKQIRVGINNPPAPPKRDIDLIGWKVPAASIQVKLTTSFVRQIDQMAEVKSAELGDPKGFRRLKQYRALACAHAIYRSWKKPEVNTRDIDFLNRISRYISYSKGVEL